MAKKIAKQEAIYARQSVDKKDSVSIETQIDECMKHCSSKSPRVYQDKGYSGKNTDRPELQKLRRDIEMGIIGRVVVYKLDRISRNIVDFYKLYEVMQTHECEFVSHSEAFDTTSTMGRAMMGILAVFAQMERENIVMRVKDNYDFRLKNGTWATGKAPFGFRNGKTADGQKTLIPVPEEMEAVKWMFNIYATSPNISLGQIQAMLMQKGLSGHQSEKGMSRTTIGHILTNPIYCQADKFLYQYYQQKLITFINDEKEWDGSRAAAIVGKNGRSLRNDDLDGISVYLTNVTGTIDSRTFLAVQKRMEENSAIASDNSPLHSLQELSGLLKCADCGSAVKMQAPPTLVCQGRNQKRICANSFAGVRLASIQEQVAVEVQAHFSRIHEDAQAKQRRRTQALNEIKKMEKQLDNLIDLATTSDAVADTIKARIDTLVVAINEKKLNLNLDDAEDTLSLRLGDSVPIFGIITHDGTVTLQYSALSTEKKQAVLRVLVNRVLLHTDGTITIDWK